MSEKFALEVAPRSVTGKQVNALRRDGIVPGVVYGPLHPAPASVQVDWTTLRPVLLKAGGTSLIDLKLEGETVSVLVRDVQRHPVRRDVMHIDFYAVDVTQTIRTVVPVVVPDADAVGKRLDARLFQPVNRIEVESLPGNIPHEVEVDASVLQEAGDNVTVADLPALEGVTYLADDDQVLIRTVSLAILAAAAEAAEELESEVVEEEVVELGEVEVIARGKEDEEEEGEEE